MNAFRVFLIAVVSLVLAGCWPTLSLNPLFDLEEMSGMVSDDRLTGTWSAVSPDGAKTIGAGTWVIESVQEDELEFYAIDHTDRGGDSGNLFAALVEIEGHLYINMHPDRPGAGDELARSSLYENQHLPLWGFARLEIGDEEIRSSIINPDWLRKFVKLNPDALDHVQCDSCVDERIVLNMPSAKLREFLAMHPFDDRAFVDWLVFTRIDAAKDAANAEG